MPSPIKIPLPSLKDLKAANAAANVVAVVPEEGDGEVTTTVPDENTAILSALYLEFTRVN